MIMIKSAKGHSNSALSYRYYNTFPLYGTAYRGYHAFQGSEHHSDCASLLNGLGCQSSVGCQVGGDCQRDASQYV